MINRKSILPHGYHEVQERRLVRLRRVEASWRIDSRSVNNVKPSVQSGLEGYEGHEFDVAVGELRPCTKGIEER